MIKLHGAPRSNYFNMVKTVLLEKGIEFEEVMTPPSQEDDHLARSAVGKIPCLETEQGFLAETGVIINYLEELCPEPALMPKDPWERAKVRELAHSLELYVELVARKGFGALMGGEVPEHVKELLAIEFPKGAAAISRLAKFSPYIAGEEFTYADLVGYFTMVYASLSAERNVSYDLFAGIPGAAEWYEMIGQRESVQQALGDQQR